MAERSFGSSALWRAASASTTGNSARERQFFVPFMPLPGRGPAPGVNHPCSNAGHTPKW